jgi:hypothetical protein
MSTEKKNPLKRGQALNDATNGQMGEEPRPDPLPDSSPDLNQGIEDSRRKAARKLSKHIWSKDPLNHLVLENNIISPFPFSSLELSANQTNSYLTIITFYRDITSINLITLPRDCPTYGKTSTFKYDSDRQQLNTNLSIV